MFTLLGELNLWTFDDNISIRDTDLGAFRYHDKRVDNLYEEGKKSYGQRRGMIYIPTNKKGNKLKDSIKYLEEQLRDNSIIYCQWYDDCTLRLMLSNAVLVHIQLNGETGDVQKIVFDKYLAGKLSEHISDVAITRNHIVCTCNDNQISIVHFTKSKRHAFDKINKLEPKLSMTDLYGPNGRRVDKKIQVNKSDDLVLIWWKSTMNEVYPWSPTMKEHDRANVHLYRLTGAKLELICYVRSEFDPLCITFDVYHDNVIHSVEQKVSRKGEVTVEWRTYEVSQQDKLQRIAVVSVPLPTHTSCVKFSPNQELLLLCCIDGSVMLYDQMRAATANVKAAFIPTLASWHSDGIIFVIGNDRGQFQHFDISLSCVKSQTLSEEASPANILDLSPYFRIQPGLLRMEWNRRTDSGCYTTACNHGNSFLLLLFQRGPLGVIRIVEGDSLPGDALVRRYLSLSQIDQATSLLLAMNWDTYPRACMHSLNQTLNYLFKLPLTPERENLMQNALGSFHVPVKPISQSVEEEYGDEVRDLTRRFFYHLLRYRMFEKAFRLAIDLNDHDLFMDIHFYALVVNDMTMATAAKEKAERILSRSNSCSSSHSTCSRASCSLCSDSASDKEEDQVSCSDSEDSASRSQTDQPRSYRHRKEHSHSQIPPLPVLHPHHAVSFTDLATGNKTDPNLATTSFNVPPSTVTFGHSPIPGTFFASTAFNKPHKKPHTSPGSVTSNALQSFNNISDDLMTTSFGSLSLTEVEPTRPNEDNTEPGKSLNSEELYPFDKVEGTSLQLQLQQDNSFMSTSFNSEAVPVEITPEIASSLVHVDSNIMSTSFSSVIPEIPPAYNSSFGSLLTSSKPENASTLKAMKPGILARGDSTSKLATSFYTTPGNLMSTSFNFEDQPAETSGIAKEDEQKQCFLKKQVDFNVPPPPSLTSSFANYLQGLPRKNLPLSRSTSGLADMDDAAQRFTAKSSIGQSHPMQKQTLSQGLKYTQTRPARTYRLNYDLNYMPFHGSCDNIDIHSNTGLSYHPSYVVQGRFEGRHPRLVSGQNGIAKEQKISSNVPPLPVIGPTSASNSKTCPPACPAVFMDNPVASEKPKVKFSDTVTHILVPGTSHQSYKQKRSTVTQLHITDPKRELAESLPLCLGNEDYLKDFQPLSKDDTNEKTKESIKTEEGSKIKVVHFGLL